MELVDLKVKFVEGLKADADRRTGENLKRPPLHTWREWRIVLIRIENATKNTIVIRPSMQTELLNWQDALKGREALRSSDESATPFRTAIALDLKAAMSNSWQEFNGDALPITAGLSPLLIL